MRKQNPDLLYLRALVVYLTKFSVTHVSLYSIEQSDGKKCKSVPLQAWSGPEGSRKLKFPDYVTMAQDGGKVVSLTHRPLLPLGDIPGTHFC